MNATTGEGVWSRDLSLEVYDFHSHRWFTKYFVPSSAAVANGIVYFGTVNREDISDGLFFGLNATDGSEIWSQAISSDSVTCPAIANGVVYIGSNDYNLYAFDCFTGEVVWSFASQDKITSSPVVATNIVYFGSTDKTLYTLDAEDGSKIWSLTVESTITAGIAVEDKELFFCTSDPTVYAIVQSSVVASANIDAVFTNMWIAFGLIETSIIIFACVIMLSALKNASDDPKAIILGLVMLITTIVSLIVGFLVIVAFQNSFTSLSFLMP